MITLFIESVILFSFKKLSNHEDIIPLCLFNRLKIESLEQLNWSRELQLEKSMNVNSVNIFAKHR